MEEILGSAPIKTKAGGETTAAEAFKDAKIVGLYFSMHNCPPCRAFTPVLAELYKETNADHHTFEVVFLSGDKT